MFFNAVVALDATDDAPHEVVARAGRPQQEPAADGAWEVDPQELPGVSVHSSDRNGAVPVAWAVLTPPADRSREPRCGGGPVPR